MKQIFFIILFLTQILFAQSLKISQFPSVSNTATTSSTMFLVASSGATKNLKLGELDKRWQWSATAPLSKSAGENSVLSMPSASAGTNGYLLSTDWIDFSSKLSPSGVATVTNKDIDGGTASNSNRITLPKNSKTNLDALTRKEGTLVYDTTGAKVYYDDGSTLKAVGSGSGGAKNYVTGGDAESGISGFLVSKNTSAGAAPDSGFVSAGTTITFAVSSTTPLADTNSFLYTKTAANSQGQQVYVPFTIDSSSKAKVLQISFDYLVNTGTFAAGTPSTDSDVTVWVYDVTNAVFIQPSSYRLLSNSSTIADKFNATFQTASNSTSYRLVFHVATTSASAFQLKLDSVAVSPSTYVYGTPVTDWQSYTPTFTGFGTPTSVASYWRRVGDSVQIKGYCVTGTMTAVEARLSLPNNIVSDSSKLSSAAQVVGDSASGGSSSTYFRSNVLVEQNVSYVTFGVRKSTSDDLTKATGTNLVGNGSSFSWEAQVPILGWSSSVQTSDQTDTRIVMFSGNKASGQAVTANTTNITYTSLKDTHGAWNGTDTYTVPIAGDYIISMTTNASGSAEIIAYVGGTSTSRMVGTANTSNWLGASNIVYNLKIGDLLTFRSTASVTINGSAGQNNISISRISGPSAIAASESVSARYYVSTGVSTTAANPFNFDTKDWDSHGAVTTGATTWKFTAPISGEYLATGVIFTNVAGSFLLYKGGVNNRLLNGFVGSTSIPSISTKIKLLAGEFIDVRANATGTPVAAGGSTVSGSNYIEINRVGNY